MANGMKKSVGISVSVLAGAVALGALSQAASAAALSFNPLNPTAILAQARGLDTAAEAIANSPAPDTAGGLTVAAESVDAAKDKPDKSKVKPPKDNNGNHNGQDD